MNAPTLETPEIDLGAERDLSSAETDALSGGAPTATGPTGINVGGHTVTRSTQHLPEEQRDLVRWLHDHARKQRMSWPEVHAATGIHTTTLYRIFNDKYRYDAGHEQAGQRVPLDNICEKIVKYKSKAEKSGKAVNPDFIRTTTAERIYWLCERAARNHKMGFIFGDGQVGVTSALRQYAAEHNGGRTAYAEVPPAGIVYLVKKIANAVEVPDTLGYYLMLDKILEAVDASKLLLFDEVDRIISSFSQKSQVKAIETFRWIHDQTGCGMILAGNNLWRNYIEKGKFHLELRRCRRRGRSYELQLPTEPPLQDLNMFAEHFGLDPLFELDAKGNFRRFTHDKAGPIVDHIAKYDGIGVFKTRLIDAKDYAAKKAVDLNWDHFVKAYAITEKAGQRLS